MIPQVSFVGHDTQVQRKCLSKLQLNVNLNSVIPVEADNQQQQTEPALQQTSERPLSLDNDENVTAMAMFLPQRILMHIDYSEVVDRIRAAKYVQRPKPLVNSTNRNYLFWGRERYLITKFEMDDGDEYYVLTTCLISDCGGNRCLNENQYYGQTIFLYSPSPSPETEKIVTIMLIKPLAIGIQNAVNQD
ncbi:hypothetical protein AGLY_004604 [Aphis glycines]|uniref:Uncharacterized protein n=1 Tax=Aphis glycines TaxID=307491 RepID=A0A6G0TUF5_APHGL|nr:hypothetical protein AGLY_004604 [Aphis glycines]